MKTKIEYDELTNDELEVYYDIADVILDELLMPDFTEAEDDPEQVDLIVRELIDFENSILEREGVI
jgi:hypothetical protein